jgi:5'-nucleotidase
MLEFPKDLSQARILISNDDSIHSDGIRVLEKAALSITPHVWVVAPETQQSAAGHSLTIHSPLRIKHYDARHVSVYGTPTDSVLVGVQKVMAEARPHIVLSGVNHGQNTGDDVTYSGTIAAAIEATLMGIPAIAFSQDHDETSQSPVDFTVAERVLPGLLRRFQGMAWENNVVMNVNLPLPRPGVTPAYRVVPQGHYSMEKQDMVNCTDPRGRPYYWIGPPPLRDTLDTTRDIGMLHSGHVTITPLSLNLTHYPTLEALQRNFDVENAA